MDEIKFDIIEHLGVLKASAGGWSRELNVISWCSRPPVYDIRDWSPDHKKCSRGLTFSEAEGQKIAEWIFKRQKEAENE